MVPQTSRDEKMNSLQKDTAKVKTADNIKTNFEPRFTEYTSVLTPNSVFKKSNFFMYWLIENNGTSRDLLGNFGRQFNKMDLSYYS